MVFRSADFEFEFGFWVWCWFVVAVIFDDDDEVAGFVVRDDGNGAVRVLSSEIKSKLSLLLI